MLVAFLMLSMGEVCAQGASKTHMEDYYPDGDGPIANLVILTDAFVAGGPYLRAQVKEIEVTGYRYRGVTYSGSDLADCGITFPFKASSGYISMSGGGGTVGTASRCTYYDEMGSKNVHMNVVTDWDFSRGMSEGQKTCFNENNSTGNSDWMQNAYVSVVFVNSVSIGNSPYGGNGLIQASISRCLSERKAAQDQKEREEREEQQAETKQDNTATGSQVKEKSKDKTKEKRPEKDSPKKDDNEEDSGVSAEAQWKYAAYNRAMSQAQAAENRGDYAAAQSYYQDAYRIFPSAQLSQKIKEMETQQGVQMAALFIIGFSELDPGPGRLRGQLDMRAGWGRYDFNRNGSLPGFYSTGLQVDLDIEHTIWLDKQWRLGVFGGISSFASTAASGTYFNASGIELNTQFNNEAFEVKVGDVKVYAGLNLYGVVQLGYMYQALQLSGTYEPNGTWSGGSEYVNIPYGGSWHVAQGWMGSLSLLRQKRTRLKISGWYTGNRNSQPFSLINDEGRGAQILSYGYKVELGLRAWTFAFFTGSDSYFNRGLGENSPLLGTPGYEARRDLGADYYGFTLGFGAPW